MHDNPYVYIQMCALKKKTLAAALKPMIDAIRNDLECVH